MLFHHISYNITSIAYNHHTDICHLLTYLNVVLTSAEEALDCVKSLGVALTTCTVPGAPPSDRLSDPDKWEVGLGIHGEPGRYVSHF